jgi:hypothetical protein
MQGSNEILKQRKYVCVELQHITTVKDVCFIFTCLDVIYRTGTMKKKLIYAINQSEML